MNFRKHGNDLRELLGNPGYNVSTRWTGCYVISQTKAPVDFKQEHYYKLGKAGGFKSGLFGRLQTYNICWPAKEEFWVHAIIVTGDASRLSENQSGDVKENTVEQALIKATKQYTVSLDQTLTTQNPELAAEKSRREWRLMSRSKLQETLGQFVGNKAHKRRWYWLVLFGENGWKIYAHDFFSGGQVAGNVELTGTTAISPTHRLKPYIRNDFHLMLPAEDNWKLKRVLFFSLVNPSYAWGPTWRDSDTYYCTEWEDGDGKVLGNTWLSGMVIAGKDAYRIWYKGTNQRSKVAKQGGRNLYSYDPNHTIKPDAVKKFKPCLVKLAKNKQLKQVGDYKKVLQKLSLDPEGRQLYRNPCSKLTIPISTNTTNGAVTGNTWKSLFDLVTYYRDQANLNIGPKLTAKQKAYKKRVNRGRNQLKGSGVKRKKSSQKKNSNNPYTEKNENEIKKKKSRIGN